jgi:hypothetical protein
MAQWQSKVPDKCQLNGEEIFNTFIDGATMFGWCIMCPNCHKIMGMGLGVGQGQQYFKTVSPTGAVTWQTK